MQLDFHNVPPSKGELNLACWPPDLAANERADSNLAEIDLAEFGELVARYQDRLFHTVLRLLGNAEDARDVVQDTFLRAYERRHTFNAESLFFTWLYRIAINNIISMKRKERRERTFQPAWGERSRIDPPDVCRAHQPGYFLEMAEQEGKVHDALGKLSLEHRSVLVMKDMEEMKYEDIAEILGVPVGTIRSRLNRARLRLRQILTHRN